MVMKFLNSLFLTNQDSFGIMGPPGPVGPAGPAGKRGPKGESIVINEQDTHSIRLPIDIVVCKGAGTPTISEIFFVRQKLEIVKHFYNRYSIILQINVKGLSNVHSLNYELQEMFDLYYLNPMGNGRLTGYVGIDNNYIGPDNLNFVGQISSKTGPWGSFIVAGAYPKQFIPDISVYNMMDQIIIHEIGHYLLDANNDDHESDTFMDAIISRSEIVTDAQKEKLLEGALEWGGY